MDTKLILLTALFLLSLLLFYGLPEDRISPALTFNTPSALTGDPPALQPSGLAREVGQLRRDQARLHREISRLHHLLVMQRAAIETSGPQRSSCTAEEATNDASGITVYLETADRASSEGGPQWTAISFRDAGVSADGTRTAVLAIHKTALQRQEPALDSRSKRVSWQ
jgi:hypothetical protein